MEPVPAKRSKVEISVKSILLRRILNKLSLARSVVGLTGRLVGGFNLLPLYSPAIILIEDFILLK